MFWLSLMEINSTTIGNHSRRVADLSKNIGKQMGLENEDLRQLEVAGLLHDIGKLTLPSQILLKDRTRLTNSERKTLQSHATEGEAIVRAIPNLGDAATFIRHHHERFNGSGYPDALKAEEIPLGARIVAVADAFDKRFNAKDDFSEQTAADAVSTLADRGNEWFDANVVGALGEVVSGSDQVNEAIDQVIELNVEDLQAGMVLAKDVLTDSGALLLPAEYELTDAAIARLSTNKSASLVAGIAVLRRRATGEDDQSTDGQPEGEGSGGRNVAEAAVTVA